MTGVSTLGQALDQIEKIKEQQLLFSTLSTQLASGKKTQAFSGLGSDVLISKRARADFKSLETYTNNIKNADRRIQLMLNAVKEFKAQAKILSDALVGFSKEGVHQEGEIIFYDDPLTPEVENVPVGMTSAEPDVDFNTLRELSEKVMLFMKDLMNVKDNDRYLLSGSETLTKPLGSTSTMDSAISSLITGWKAGTISTDDLIADLRDRTATAGNPNAITDTIFGYSAPLSAGNVGNIYARVSDSTEIEFTALANDQAFRDIMVAASYLMNETLPPIADTYEPPNTYPGVPDAQGAPGADLDEMKENFYAVFDAVSQMVGNAIDKIQQIEFKLEGARARITEIKDSHKNAQNLLLSTISDVEDVDLNEVAVKLSTLEITLDASFRVTAKLQELSLTNYLAIG